MTVLVVVLALVLSLVVGVGAVVAVRYRRAQRSVGKIQNAAPRSESALSENASETEWGHAASLLEETAAPTPVDAVGLNGAIDALGIRLRDLESTAEARGEWMVRLAEAIARMTEGVVISDSTGEVIFREGTALATIPSLHGRTLMDAALNRVLGRAGEGMTVREEVRLYGPPQRVFLLNASPLFGGALALVEEITERERVETLRRDFVANISHELRTPVGAISLLAETLTELLSDCARTAEQASFSAQDHEIAVGLAGRLISEADRMTRAIDDLAELSRVERETNGERSVVALQDVVNAVVERLANAAEQYEIAVSVAAPSDPVLVHVNRRQVASAVHNLLDNALKYSSAGSSVSVRIRRWDLTAELSVQDTGVGIPQADLSRIFERFYRVDRSRTSSSGGIGLGLAIVRHVALNHGGDIEVESMEGEGSTFSLRLPLIAETASRESAGTESDLEQPGIGSSPRSSPKEPDSLHQVPR